MKHECVKNSGIEREMSLCYVCSCGEQVGVEEFTEDEILDLEFLINTQITLCQSVKRSTAEWENGSTAKKIQCDTEILRLSKLLEKVRKM